MTNFLGEEDVAIEATLNGKPLKRRVKARRHLADFLRQDMELPEPISAASTASVAHAPS